MQPTDPDGIHHAEPFIDHAWRVMEWHRERAEAWDRQAAQVVAFSGIIIALAPNILPLLRSVRDSIFRHILAGAVALGIATLIASAVIALLSLSGRLRSQRSPTEDIQLQWNRYRKQGNGSGEFIVGIAQTLIGDPGERTAIIDLRDAADRRETLTRRSVAGLAVGVILLAIVLGIKVIST
jgi:hypothetical protein